jgi:hypothetical protein
MEHAKRNQCMLFMVLFHIYAELRPFGFLHRWDNVYQHTKPNEPSAILHQSPSPTNDNNVDTLSLYPHVPFSYVSTLGLAVIIIIFKYILIISYYYDYNMIILQLQYNMVVIFNCNNRWNLNEFKLALPTQDLYSNSQGTSSTPSRFPKWVQDISQLVYSNKNYGLHYVDLILPCGSPLWMHLKILSNWAHS